MLTKWRISETAVSTAGLIIAVIGVMGVSLLSLTIPGWAAIILGLILIFSQNKPQASPLRWPLLLLIIMSGVSIFVTADRGVTAGQISQLLAGIAGFFALVNWARGRQRLLLVSLALLLGGTLIATAAPFIVAWDLTSGVPIPLAIYRAFPLLLSDAVHPNIMASIMLLLLPLSFSYLLIMRQENSWPLSTWWGKGIIIASLILMSLVFILTKSRGGYAAGAIGVLLVFWLFGRRVLTGAITIVLIAVVVWLIAGSEQQTAMIVGDVANTDTIEFRIQVWQTATRMIGDFAYTGIGMGTFNDVAMRLYPYPNVPNPGAHNLAMQVGLDLGIPGLIAYLAILLLALFMAAIPLSRLVNGRGHSLWAMFVGLLAGLVGLLCHGFVDVGVWGTRIAFLPWLVLALITAGHIHVCQIAVE